jgi:hypothetical protein
LPSNAHENNMSKKRNGKRDRRANFDFFNEIQEPGAALDGLLKPVDEAFFDGPLVSWDDSVLNDLLPPFDVSVLDDLLPLRDESVLDALLPPLDTSFLDGLVPSPNEIVRDDTLEGVDDTVVTSDLRHKKRPRCVEKRRPRRTGGKPRS